MYLHFAIENCGVSLTAKQARVIFDLPASQAKRHTGGAGLGPFAWLFGLYHMQWNAITVQSRNNRNNLNKDLQVIHSFKHSTRKDDCDNEKQWPDKDRYNQNMVIGCGTIDKPSPGHSPDGRDFDKPDGSKGDEMFADFYDGWNFYKEKGASIDIHGSGQWESRKVTLYKN
eukprot:gene33811-41710_t